MPTVQVDLFKAWHQKIFNLIQQVDQKEEHYAIGTFLLLAVGESTQNIILLQRILHQIISKKKKKLVTG